MSLTLELARFRAPEAAVGKLLEERPAMVSALRARFPACLAAYLTREDDGSFLDVVVWASRREAEQAADLIDTVPDCKSWFRHISESGGLRHVEVLHHWPTKPDGSRYAGSDVA